MNHSPLLIVRASAPLRRWLLAGGLLLVTLIALYVAFDWGRRNAGFDSSKARAQNGDLRGQVRDLEAQLRQLRLTLAAQETERAGQVRERAELAKTIGDLQAEVARQRQDLSFYRGVVGENLQGEMLKIQQFHITVGKEPGQYHLRLVLGRTLRPDDMVSGAVQISFEGTDGENRAAALDLATVSTVAGDALNFNYRYVETLERDIRLPSGFTPERTTIELQPTRKGVNKIRQTFLWNVDTP
jgi:hypothetical protein